MEIFHTTVSSTNYITVREIERDLSKLVPLYRAKSMIFRTIEILKIPDTLRTNPRFIALLERVAAMK